MIAPMSSKDRALRKFGLNVARAREACGLSQDKLAEKADIDRTYLSGIERGVRNPGIRTVLSLARALGIGVEDLCKGVDV